MESSEAEIEEFLAFYPPRIAIQTVRLRALMKRAVPDALERIRPGWRLIGYDLPGSASGRYFAWVWPEPEHVHVGWQAGTLMNDPKHLLRGAHIKLKKVRYLTFTATDRIPTDVVVSFTREAARITGMSRSERSFLAESRRQSQST